MICSKNGIRQCVRGFSSSSGNAIKTALYDVHVERGGKMVEFAGYYLPVQYETGVKTEHLHTREKAALFDVSHMGQIKIHGPDRVAFLESLIVADVQALEEGHTQLSLLTNKQGGIIDDTIVAKQSGALGMVLNGACKHKDLKHMHEHLSKFNASIEHMEDYSLLALQGPTAKRVLQDMTSLDLSKLLFTMQAHGQVAGIDCLITRCGYTGEDGFEISVANKDAAALMKAILKDGEVMPCGLGARDSLRLESGLCLYGNDIDETTTPVSAGLLWTINPRRRAEGGFTGSDIILAEIKNKPATKRVGMVVNGPPARSHVELFSDESGSKRIGEITSGTFGPSLGKPIAMGYVDQDFSKLGTSIFAKIRNKFVPTTVSKMPFVKQNYYRG